MWQVASQFFLEGMTVGNDLPRSIGRTGINRDTPIVAFEVAERQAREKREYDEKIKRRRKTMRFSELQINMELS